MPRFSDPEPLSIRHVLGGFACGIESLDFWLERHARASAPAGSARTYVVTDSHQGQVVGYHALVTAALPHVEAISRVARGMPRHEIPAVLIARLAVDRSVRGVGLGRFLLKDAMVRALAVSEVAGSRVLVVHAIDERAASFYVHHGFERSPSDPMNLQMIMKDIRATLTS